MSLFGTSGIRDRVGEQLSVESCLEIGRAVGSTLSPASRVCLSTDTRVSRDVIKTAFISGLLSVGVNVTDLGILPTPALALLTRELDFDSGVMITASHNPPDYNGIKLFNGDTLGFSREQEKEIESRYLSRQFRQPGWRECGCLFGEENAGEKYLHALENKISSWNNSPRVKLVVDPGNGAACSLAPALFRRLGFEVFPINDAPDGLFPGRSAEPTAETLGGTVGFLKDCNADLAICFDGDADRVVFCDRQGFLGYNEMIAYISRLAVRESGKAKVVTTVETGRLLDAAVADLSARVFRTMVGDVPLAYSVRERDAAIGVEQVGVYILPQVGYYPESFLAALFLLSHLDNVGEIRDFYRRLPSFFFEKVKISCPDELKEAVMAKCQANLDSSGGEVNRLDGIRIDFPHSWLLVRPSGTEPVIRLLVEADSPDRLAELVSRYAPVIEEAIARSGGKG